METKKNSTYAISIITSAMVWGLVNVGCSLKLKGTGCYESISAILFGGAASHLIIVFPLLINRLKSLQKKSRLKMPVRPMVFMAALTIISCNQDPVGYLEVRNHTDETFTNVSWGELIHLGTIAPGEEDGDETESFTSKHIYLDIGSGTYRSHKEIFVDANSSATFIIHDKNQLEKLE